RVAELFDHAGDRVQPELFFVHRLHVGAAHALHDRVEEAFALGRATAVAVERAAEQPGASDEGRGDQRRRGEEAEAVHWARSLNDPRATWVSTCTPVIPCPPRDSAAPGSAPRSRRARAPQPAPA